MDCTRMTKNGPISEFTELKKQITKPTRRKVLNDAGGSRCNIHNGNRSRGPELALYSDK